MSEASPGAPGLLADYRNAAVGNETPAFVTRLDTGQATLVGRKCELALRTDFGHHQLHCTLLFDRGIMVIALLNLNL